MKKLYNHQKLFLKKNPDKALLCWEAGTGKTIGACIWLRQNRDSNALVICPKRIKEKWKSTLQEWGTKAIVISKEEFKKSTLQEWSAIVVDELDEFCSPLFISKLRSQLSTTLYSQIKKTPHTPFLGLTATPVRSSPANLHSALTFIGHYIEWEKWRNNFYELQKLPYLPRPAYLPKKDWREKMRPIIEKYTEIVLLKDCVDIPEITEEKIYIKNKTKKHYENFFEEHRDEQKEKIKEILKIGKDYNKVFIVAYYREQIETLQKELSKDRETFVIYGGINNQEEIIQNASKSTNCFFLCQASLGNGFDADSFSCCVFASISYSVRDYIQIKARLCRIHNLHPIHYITLIGGRCDEAILKNIEKGKDFTPSLWK